MAQEASQVLARLSVLTRTIAALLLVLLLSAIGMNVELRQLNAKLAALNAPLPIIPDTVRR
jgi:hypothetical protein